MAIHNGTRKVYVLLLLMIVGIVSLLFACRTTSSYVHDSIIKDVSLKEFTQPSQLATEIIYKDMLVVHFNTSSTDAAGADMEHVPAVPLRISHRLHFDRRNTNKVNPFNPYMICGDRNLHPEMEAAAGILDFSTSIRTTLKILLMGDSVGIQLSQTLEEAMGADPCARKVIRYSWWGKAGSASPNEGLHVSAPIQGGGVMAGWRITGILNKDGENKKGPNACCGGWSREDSRKLLHQNYTVDNVTMPIDSFDVLIFRIPHGWIGLDHVTEKKLLEMIELASELFGVNTVMILTLPYINNVKTLGDIRQLKDTNDMIHKFSQNWPSAGKHGVDRVQVLDFATFGDSLMEWNARLMGMDTSSANYTLESIQANKKSGNQQRSIAQVCAKRVPDQATTCEPSGFSKDGMHWCMDRLGGRLVAAISCLLGCVYNQNDKNASTKSSSKTVIEACERSCNDQFMTLTSVLLHGNNAANGSLPLLVKSSISSATSNKCTKGQK